MWYQHVPTPSYLTVFPIIQTYVLRWFGHCLPTLAGTDLFLISWIMNATPKVTPDRAPGYTRSYQGLALGGRNGTARFTLHLYVSNGVNNSCILRRSCHPAHRFVGRQTTSRHHRYARKAHLRYHDILTRQTRASQVRTIIRSQPGSGWECSLCSFVPRWSPVRHPWRANPNDVRLTSWVMRSFSPY